MFYVAKDSSSVGKNEVLGIAMWMPPRPVGLRESWGEWWQDWYLWAQQVGMNVWYARGGLNVKVSWRFIKRNIEVID